jgi:DNA-directed RNA polymerase subunit beta
MADLFDTHEQFENIKRSLSGAVKDALTIEGKKNRLVVKKVEVDDNLSPEDLKSQLDAKLSGKTWGVPLYADIELQDAKSGEPLDRQRIKLLDIPKLTPRYSFIVNGSEFQISNQLRLKSGAYIRKRRTGETEAFINLEKGRNFRIELKPEKNQVVAEIGSVNVNVYSLMHILGVKDKEMQDALGETLHSAIVTPNVDVDILKLHQSLFRQKEPDVEKALSNLRAYFKETKISPETTEATLGRSFTSVDGGMMLRTVKKLVAVNKGDEEADNRDEIRFKKLFTPDDLLEQRISKNVRLIQSRIKPYLDASTEVRDVIQPRQIAKLIYAGHGEDSTGSFYNSSALSNSADQTNPVDFLSGFSKVTYLGEGGILDRHAITLPSRNINPTQIGFLDPVQSPENADIGVVNHIPLGVTKRQGEMKTRVMDRSGKQVYLSSHDAYAQTIAMPGEVDEKWKPLWGGRVSAYRAGKVVDVPASELTHRFIDPADLFGITTNLIPFLSADSGARAMMGTKMLTQAVPLVEREAPLVQARLKGEMSADRAVGTEFAIHSPVSGTIASINDGFIKITDKNGESHEVQYYDNFPMNGDVGMSSDLKVIPGDTVKEGQLIADSNFTKDGTLALGKNLKVAYLPYKGYTFEDGIVISEATAKKMTSEHLHRREAPRVKAGGAATIYDKEKFNAYYPANFTREQLAKLDEQGVIQVGQKVGPGDPIVAFMQEKAITPEDVAMGKLRKSLVKPFKNRSVSWDLDDEGLVVRVAKTAEGPVVWVKTKEPVRIGDKLAGRHGNKGVVTMIVPDREMPQTGDGEAVDIIMDPHGIPSRINVGQVFETVAGKIARGRKEPYLVDNFTEGSYIDMLKDEVKKAKLTDREKVSDPSTGESLGDALVGYQYILKMKHAVRTKFAGRGTDKYTVDNRPAKGGETSAQSLDPLKMFSMLAHGAKANIREMSTYKAEDNPEFWLALQKKQALPSPKPTFAWEKFVNMMRASGINVKKEGDTIRPVPFTDDEILAMSSGAIKDAKYFRAKDLRPEEGGLFDPVITGGVGGGRWGHIPLNEPMPNPVFEDAIRSVTGLTEEQFDNLVAGRSKIDAKGDFVP